MIRQVLRAGAVAAILAGAVGTIVAGTTTARADGPIVIKFSHVVAPDTPKGAGALKFKEECYVPCTGYHSGEMKHGPIAMIEPGTPVVCVVPNDSQRSRTIINMREALARGAHLVAIHTEGDKEVGEMCRHSIAVPPTAEYTSPLLTTLPLQLLAYHAALAVGADVDKPRNLAKSVTVA